MSVKDVIKSSIYEALGGGTNLSTRTLLTILVMACMIGIYLFMVYKLSSKSAFYSKDLNVTIAGLPIIVAAIMIAMQSSLIVSLGMVGALSIVRFRNAVKNPVDLLYLFWSISAGIIVGVGLYILAVVLCIMMTVLMLVLGMVPNAKTPDLLVLRGSCEKMDYDMIYDIVGKSSRYYKEKARCIKGDDVEVILELRSRDKEKLIKDLRDTGRFIQINCVSHDGECRV